MGTLATSAQIGIAGGRPVAILSESHPWQRNAELQIGMRTGYCGSLTTFGGWISEVFTNAIHHNAWMNAVGAVFVGTASALASFTIGTHVALAFDRQVALVEACGGRAAWGSGSKPYRNIISPFTKTKWYCGTSAWAARVDCEPESKISTNRC